MNNYKKIKNIAQGRFSKITLAKSLRTGKNCIIKISKKTKYKANATESQILAEMDNPNIIKYIESYEDNHNNYIVMEYADGNDLDKKIKSFPGVIPEDKVLYYFIQICSAIKYIHDRKIIHRDIKPQNIFITKDDIIKLGDFGSANYMKTNFLEDTEGTDYYMAPEIIHYEKYDFKVDIWSLGCVLYEMCKKKSPFIPGEREGMVDAIKRKPERIPPEYSKDLQNLINKMLSMSPNSRPTINEILSTPFILKKIHELIVIRPSCLHQNPIKVKLVLLGLKKGKSRILEGLTNYCCESHLGNMKIFLREQNVELTVLDTPFNDNYGFASHVFYRCANIFLICFSPNSRKTYEDAIECYNNIKVFRNDGIICLCGDDSNVSLKKSEVSFNDTFFEAKNLKIDCYFETFLDSSINVFMMLNEIVDIWLNKMKNFQTLLPGLDINSFDKTKNGCTFT